MQKSNHPAALGCVRHGHGSDDETSGPKIANTECENDDLRVRPLVADTAKLLNGRDHFAMRRNAAYSSHSAPLQLLWGQLRTASGRAVNDNILALATRTSYSCTPAFEIRIPPTRESY
jgi:hypothetical protein